MLSRQRNITGFVRAEPKEIKHVLGITFDVLVEVHAIGCIYEQKLKDVYFTEYHADPKVNPNEVVAKFMAGGWSGWRSW